MREGLTALCHAKTMGTCLKNIPKLHRTLYLIIWALKSMSPVRFSHIAYGSNRQPHYFPKNTTKGAPFENDKTSFAVSILPKKAYDPLNINSTTPPSCCAMPNRLDKVVIRTSSPSGYVRFHWHMVFVFSTEATNSILHLVLLLFNALKF